jgi:hypothetical protein
MSEDTSWTKIIATDGGSVESSPPVDSTVQFMNVAWGLDAL